MLQPYTESAIALSDIYTDTNPIVLPCLLARGVKIGEF